MRGWVILEYSFSFIAVKYYIFHSTYTGWNIGSSCEFPFQCTFLAADGTCSSLNTEITFFAKTQLQKHISLGMRSFGRLLSPRRESDKSIGSGASLSPTEQSRRVRRTSGYNYRPRMAPVRSRSSGNVQAKQQDTGERARRVSWSPEVLYREFESDASILDELERLDAEVSPIQAHSVQKAHKKKKKKSESAKAPVIPQSLDDGDDMYFL